MAIKQAPVPLVSVGSGVKPNQYRLWAGAALTLVCCVVLAAALVGRRSTATVDVASQGSTQSSSNSPPLVPDEKLEKLRASFARSDNKMTRVDSIEIRRLTWRGLADQGSVSGQPPLVPEGFLNPKSPMALRDLDSDAFFIFQTGEYTSGPYKYDWRVTVFDDTTNTPFLEEGGKGLPPSYVGMLVPVSRVQPPVFDPVKPGPSLPIRP